jgi:hypothetical protein
MSDRREAVRATRMPNHRQLLNPILSALHRLVVAHQSMSWFAVSLKI